MDAKRKILTYLARRRAARGGELRAHLGISRQALSIHMQSLIDAGKVVRSGAARGARYMLPTRSPPPAVVSRKWRKNTHFSINRADKFTSAIVCA